MDDRDRRAPVALPADAPVAQPPGRLLLAQPQGHEIGRHGIDSGLVAEPVVLARVHARAALLVGIPLLPGVGREGLAFDGDHLRDRQAVLLREGEVALVVRRHAHHGAVAVPHQHVVADPHGHVVARQRMLHEEPGRHPFLLAQRQFRLARAALRALLDEGGDLRVALRRERGQRMLRRHGAERDAHDGVGARGEHPQPAVLHELAASAADVVREREAHPFALADPVLLHQPHALRPAVQVSGVGGVGHVGQQLFGVLRDREVIPGDLAPLHERVAAPAAAVDHLLVGEHRLVDRIPVDDLRLLVGDALVEQLQEEPLVPLVVARIAGGELARPVQREAERLHLRLHVGDVVARPGGRRDALVDGGVLRRQAEGIPAHRHQHVVALHAQVARHHVVDGVVAHVPHVQLARRVRKHRARVELALPRVFGHPVRVARGPVRARIGLHFGRNISFIHARLYGAPGRGWSPWPPGGAPLAAFGRLVPGDPLAAHCVGFGSTTKPMRVRPDCCRRAMSSATSP